MEMYLTMTQINDFLFCPRSLFFHDFLRENFSPSIFRETPQLKGLAAHKAIDQHTYSTRKDVLQGTVIYSRRYQLLGRIDLFDIASGCLIERKNSITAVYDGFRYQLFAQFFALMEMGYQVKKMELYSSSDNRKYPIALPDQIATADFEKVLAAMRCYSMENDVSEPNLNKCHHCNYREICSFFPEEERE